MSAFHFPSSFSLRLSHTAGQQSPIQMPYLAAFSCTPYSPCYRLRSSSHLTTIAIAISRKQIVAVQAYRGFMARPPLPLSPLSQCPHGTSPEAALPCRCTDSRRRGTSCLLQRCTARHLRGPNRLSCVYLRWCYSIKCGY